MPGPLNAGVNSADIGRIASKHVKVTVSHKNSTSVPREHRPVTARSPQKTQQPVMNEANDKDIQSSREIEEMDVTEGIDSTEGN